MPAGPGNQNTVEELPHKRNLILETALPGNWPEKLSKSHETQKESLDSNLFPRLWYPPV